MTTKNEISSLIHTVWDNDPIESICIIILDYISSERSSQIRHITTDTLQKITENQFSDDDLLKAATYLSGENPHILEIQYLFIDDNDIEEPISNEVLIEAKTNGSLIHPISGEEVDDYEDNLFFYFRPSLEARQITE